jgi:hypothetical protein
MDNPIIPKKRKQVDFKNSLEVKKIISSDTRLLSQQKVSLTPNEYKKLLSDISLEQYLMLSLGDIDRYATFIAYKRVLDIYNLICESKNINPLAINLNPIVKLNNNNAVSIIDNYYTDEVCIKKIQILHEIWMVPKDTDIPEKQKKYILTKKYGTIDKYITPFKHSKPSTTPMNDNVKQNILICFVYVEHIHKIIELLRKKNNNIIVNATKIQYEILSQILRKIMKNYNIEPEVNEYKDILLAFEDIKTEDIFSWKTINPEIKIRHIPKLPSSLKDNINFIMYNI